MGGFGGGRRGAGQPGMSAGRQRALSHDVDPEEDADVVATLGTLDNLIKFMSKLPGRKLAMFVSEGMRIFQTDRSQSLLQTTDLAARADVVFYTIDPRGLDPLNISAADDLAGQDPVQFLSDKRDDYRESQDSLNALALDTGGKFFHDNNDIKQGLNAMLEENSAYYLLGFQPEESKWDGKLHKIKVTVKGRPDLKVSTRKGYVAKNDAPSTKPSDPRVAENVEAINSPLVRRDIDLQLTPFYRDDKNGDPIFVALLHIDSSKLHFVEAEGKHKNTLELIGFVLDQRGKQVDGFAETLDMNLGNESYEKALKNGLLSTRALTVKPGAYQMRVLVRETGSGIVGTANNFVDIPNMKGNKLAVSSIFAVGESDPKPGVGSDSSGSLSQRRFHRGGKFDYTMVVYNAKAEHGNEVQLAIRTRILQGNNVIFKGDLRPIQMMQGSTPPSRVITGGQLVLGPLGPGDYTLEVAIVDKNVKKESKGIVRQEIDFSVE